MAVSGIYINFDDKKIQRKVKKILNNETKYQIADLAAKMMEPYVPMDTGTLFREFEIKLNPLGIEYTTPYAHYMYEGIVYGPNIPIIEKYGDTSVITGWYSIPGQQKHPMGRVLHYNKEHHPLATNHWDEAMMEDKSDEFYAEVSAIIQRRINEIG